MSRNENSSVDNNFSADQRTYHVPVLLKESIDALKIKPSGKYVDVTFGGGGHSGEIHKNLTEGHLYAFDQDSDAAANTSDFDKDKFTLVEANFRYLARFLRHYEVEEVDGILADLGISSHQIDEAERGFSTRFDAELDMRMNRKSGKSAITVLNDYSEKELVRIFSSYGEVRNSKTLASAIVSARSSEKITRIDQLKNILKRYAKRGSEHKYFAQVFQAIRIEVNDEMEALKDLLKDSVKVLKEGGRLSVISYHSLEDRMVKNFIQSGNFEGRQEKDLYGNVLRPLNPVTRKPIMASEEEIKNNSRARSARLRIAERNEKTEA
ncbi:MAG: 16S rRNA (cytosine(1402)-N(4))-methyltransferase RsmH [Bacteroidota bacterium]